MPCSYGLLGDSPAYHTPLDPSTPEPGPRISQGFYDGPRFKTSNTFVAASGTNRDVRDDMFEVRGRLRQDPMVHKEAGSLKFLPLPTPSQFGQWK